MIHVNPGKALRRLRELLRVPTAPFHEHWVLGRVMDFARRYELPIQRDDYGNLLVRYERPPAIGGEAMLAAPFVVVAHTDHPGFEVLGRDDKHRLEVAWMGGVKPHFFRRERVVIFSRRDIFAEIDEFHVGADRRVDRLFLKCRSDLPEPGDFGAFALPAFQHETGAATIQGRALDDLTGVAAIVSALQALAEEKAEGVLWALFTRAEEVGFVGALGACRSGLLPPSAVVVSLEASAEGHGVHGGNGPVVRVGDAATVFDPGVMATLAGVADELGRTDRHFTSQRALMSGGSCEATLFARHGYRSGGIAIPLSNYHNMGKTRIQPESVHLEDYRGAARLVAELAVHGYARAAVVASGDDALGQRLRTNEERWIGRLTETAVAPTRVREEAEPPLEPDDDAGVTE